MTGEDAELVACNREMTGSILVLKCASPKRFSASSQTVTKNAYGHRGLRHVCVCVCVCVCLSSCPSVRPSVYQPALPSLSLSACPLVSTRLQLEDFSWNFTLEALITNCRENPSLVTIGQKMPNTLREEQARFIAAGACYGIRHTEQPGTCKHCTLSAIFVAQECSSIALLPFYSTDF
jgi:hypothetical protein